MRSKRKSPEMPQDDPDDAIWARVLAHAEACGGEANDFHVVAGREHLAPERPLYLVVHPGDVVQSDNDVAYSRNRAAIQDYSRGCQSGIEEDVTRLLKAGWDVAVLHRFSSSYAFGVSGSLQEYEEAMDQIHIDGLVLFGDALDEAAAWLIAEAAAATRPAVMLSGAWSDAATGCIAALGRALQKAGARVHLADSACVSPDGSGREWRPKLPRLGRDDERRLGQNNEPEPAAA